jgi:hypothetical protein
MQRAMARQAESERERRAKIITAEGEFQASQRLREAADTLETPQAMQIRLFQTLNEVANQQNSTIILPVPMDLFKPFMEGMNGSSDGFTSQKSSGRKREADPEKIYEEAVGAASSEVDMPDKPSDSSATETSTEEPAGREASS